MASAPVAALSSGIAYSSIAAESLAGCGRARGGRAAHHDWPEAALIGEIARRHGLPLYEPSTRSASLEEAFMELTADRVQFPGGDPR